MHDAPLSYVIRQLRADAAWKHDADTLSKPRRQKRNVHLAVFVEPFLEYVLSGRKTVESRFSSVRFPPFKRVARGDLVLLKASGGPVVGVCEVGAAWFYELEQESWSTIRREFARALCAEDPEFWQSREHAEYATLMYISRVKRLEPIKWPKRDRRGWVVLRASEAELLPFGEAAMGHTVIGFSGAFASGKSTLSEAVAHALGCKRVSFGGVVRAAAKSRGLDTTRETLQQVGEELVSEDPDGFCNKVLESGGWNPGEGLVIDGIRHVDIAKRLERLVRPAEFRLVHLAAPRDVRVERLKSRGEESALGAMARLESHSTEIEVERELPEVADLLIDGSSPLEQLIDEVADWVHQLK